MNNREPVFCYFAFIKFSYIMILISKMSDQKLTNKSGFTCVTIYPTDKRGHSNANPSEGATKTKRQPDT